MIDALILASARTELAGYVRTLFFVYAIIIIAYILSSLFFNFGGRMSYNRYASAFGMAQAAGVAGDAPIEALAFDD